jgi:uncharacterized LabA/DUF88 family protein
MDKKLRAAVLIDGSNFYFKLKDLGLAKPLNFDFGKFANLLAGDLKVVSKIYYIGKVRTDGTEKVQKLFDYQQKLLSKLISTGWRYSLGYLMKTDGKVREKGVDVSMAVDIVEMACKSKIDVFYLVSSDSDLLPAVRSAIRNGKQVVYVGFSHKPSLALVANCTRSKLLEKSELEKLIN